MNTLDVCLAICNVVSDENIEEGTQPIGGLWRVYLTGKRARVELLCTGNNLRGGVGYITLNSQ